MGETFTQNKVNNCPLMSRAIHQICSIYFSTLNQIQGCAPVVESYVCRTSYGPSAFCLVSLTVLASLQFKVLDTLQML